MSKLTPRDAGLTTRYIKFKIKPDFSVGDWWVCENCKTFEPVEGNPRELNWNFCGVCGYKITEFVEVDPCTQ